MAKKNEPVIVKKVIVEEHGGHHGGAWKVAYADFVTAMMAFFLLMWILASAEEEQKKGLADYFTPTINPQPGMGGNGPLDGTTIGPDGTMNSSNSPMSTVAIPSFGQSDPMQAKSGEPEVVVEYEQGPSEAAKEMQSELQEALEEKDRQKFAELENEIVQAMNAVPDLQPLIPNVLFDETEEGLRIQIIDQEGESMFASGSAVVEGRTKKLLKLVGELISKLPNNLIISGHTDAVRQRERGNRLWQLGALRRPGQLDPPDLHHLRHLDGAHQSGCRTGRHRPPEARRPKACLQSAHERGPGIHEGPQCRRHRQGGRVHRGHQGSPEGHR
jgi:chemotaxis protein MotB